MLEERYSYSMLEMLRHVYGQAPGDKLEAHVKDGEAVCLYLSAGVLRQIAKLVKASERM